MIPFIFRAGAVGPMPPQFAGLKVFDGELKDLCLVAAADAPPDMGAVWKLRKGASDYAVYLVETFDRHASAVRIQTTAGVKAARLKT